MVNKKKSVVQPDARKRMIEQYNIVYQEYNFSLHWDTEANLSKNSKRSKWYEEQFEGIWIPKRNKLVIVEYNK